MDDFFFLSFISEALTPRGRRTASDVPSRCCTRCAELADVETATRKTAEVIREIRRWRVENKPCTNCDIDLMPMEPVAAAANSLSH